MCGRSHGYADGISKLRSKIWSEWYITSLCSIYGRSHDYAGEIFKVSPKIGSEWYITSLLLKVQAESEQNPRTVLVSEQSPSGF